jgi:hypothetical protein
VAGWKSHQAHDCPDGHPSEYEPSATLFNSSDQTPIFLLIPDSFVGIEERIFLEIALRLNLTWKLSIPEKRKVYGTPFPNKSLGGGLMTDLYKGMY